MARKRTPLSAKEVQPKKDVRWDFFTFPVAWAFAAGAFIALLLSGFFENLEVFLLASLFFFSFGNAHIITTWFRTRTLDRRRGIEEEEEAERRNFAARAAASMANATEASSGRSKRRRRGGGGSGASAN